MARVHLEEYILPSYVKEASRLLKKSIINVDMPSVELDTFEERVNEERQRLHKDNIEMEESNVERQKIRLSGKEYEKIKNVIIHFVKELEKQEIKVRQKDIVDFYIEKILDSIENEEQAYEQSRNIMAVIERLVNNENILIVTEEHQDKAERNLSLNVNYDPTISL